MFAPRCSPAIVLTIPHLQLELSCQALCFLSWCISACVLLFLVRFLHRVTTPSTVTTPTAVSIPYHLPEAEEEERVYIKTEEDEDDNTYNNENVEEGQRMDERKDDKDDKEQQVNKKDDKKKQGDVKKDEKKPQADKKKDDKKQQADKKKDDNAKEQNIGMTTETAAGGDAKRPGIRIGNGTPAASYTSGFTFGRWGPDRVQYGGRIDG